MKIGLLPLDSRPCNYSNLREMAEFSGIKLSLPEHGLIHSFNEHDFTKQQQWLKRELQSGVAAVVLSTDQWFYGGLIGSRKLNVELSEANLRLQELVKLRSEFPNVKFLLFSTLLRLTVTVNATQSEKLWKDVFRFSVLKGKSADLMSEAEKSELQSLETRIPSPVLQEYLAVRERNFMVNSKLISMAEKFDGIMFGQEDCAPEGIHQQEKAELQRLLSKQSQEISDQVVILTGADELGMQSLMRAYQKLSSVLENSIPLAFYSSDPSIWNRISLYEDITVLQNLNLHLEYSPFQLEFSTEIKKSDVVVNPFSELGQSDHLFPEFSANNDGKLGWTKEIAQQAVLDLEIGNGTSPLFWKLLHQAGKLQNLDAFSAWNTTGNRTGALIAHLGLKKIAASKNRLKEESERRYHFTRLLDDGVYQAFVRKSLWSLCKEKNLNPWALGTHTGDFEKVLTETMRAASEEFDLDVSHYEFRLPWRRLFEVEIIRRA